METDIFLELDYPFLHITYLLTLPDSTREWIYYILDIVHILKWTIHLCRLFEYFYTDIWCDWISKSSKDILCYRILNGSQDMDICVSGHQTDHRTDHRTDYWIQWTNLTVSYRGQVRLVHYCIILYTIESIPVDCIHYFNC